MLFPFAAIAVIVIGSASVPAQTSGRARTPEFWKDIVASGYTVPAGEEPFALLMQMDALLDSPDPVLRDDVAYGATAQWMYRRRLLTAGQQQALTVLWMRNLSAEGTAAGGADAPLRRSFSALNLSVAAALDNAAPFLSQEEYERLLRAALAYFAAETDTRGYDRRVGWVHAAAHTADLLKFLARSARLPAAAQSQILDALADKCGTFGEVFRWAEEGRLAEVVRSLVRRDDFDAAGFRRWLAGWPAAHAALWQHAPRLDDPARFVTVQNMTLVFRAAYVALSADADLTPAAVGARTELLAALGKMR